VHAGVQIRSPQGVGGHVPTIAAESSIPRAILLGTPYVERDGKIYECPPERRFQLLAYLAYRGEWVTRDALAFMCWPDQDNAGARRNLRWVLHSMRELPELGVIEAERDRIRVHLSTDVRQFEAAVKNAKWADAVTLYRGALCTGFDAHASEPLAKWLRLERGRLAEMFRRAAMALIDASSAIEVVPLARRLLAEDPADEEALRAALRALRELKQEREAERIYREFSERMMDELGLEPSAETRALMHERETLSSQASAPPPIESSFIGRQRELDEIALLLAQPDCRLVTLIGPGGVGKSRLAREAMSRFSAGPAWMVPLEALAVPGQLTGKVALALGIRLAARGSAELQVQTRLGDRPCLLVLDNFEHLIDAAEQAARWLVACPQLRIVVTSRERLGIEHEWLLPVEGLSTPAPVDGGFEQADSVRLFVERARAAKRGFEPSAEQEAIVRIVEQVDGMPLAIELAAAWVRVLPCIDIARDLDEGLELLQTESAGRVERRSVRASFEHSWSLLMARERELFAQLSVFRGGFSREGARQVAGAALPAIAQLVDKSLVRADGVGRFGLHPLLRQYAAEKLALSPTGEASARHRHAEFFAHWMAGYAGLGKVDLDAALPALDVEFENCRVAWDWAIEHQRADIVRTASLVLLAYFERRGRVRDGLECFAAADKLQPSTPGYGAAMGNVERGKATLMLRAGHYDEAERCARQALQRFRLNRDACGIKSSLTTLGLANWERARYAGARPYFSEGLKRCRADGDRDGEAGFLTNLALIAKADGQYSDAETLLTHAIEIYREVGDRIHLISALNNLGNLYRSLRQPARGRAPLLESLAVAEETGDLITLPFVVINLALVELELGHLDAAYSYAERALAVVRKGADRQIETGCHATLARIELARGAPGRARGHLRTAATMAREMKHVPLMLGAAINIAAALRLEGQCGASAAILYMVRSHPSAGQPDRDDVDRELAALEPTLSDDALASARERAATLALDDVISQAIDPQSPS
jgi:predicted ATPase/DNA-binding SARP family transcriptional activator